jgi:hypothetical protein
MPIEIREIIIKTEITSSGHTRQGRVNEKELGMFRKQLLEECKRMISGKTKKNSYKR